MVVETPGRIGVRPTGMRRGGRRCNGLRRLHFTTRSVVRLSRAGQVGAHDARAYARERSTPKKHRGPMLGIGPRAGSLGRWDSDFQDVGCFGASGAAHDFELDSFAFVERPESGALDGAEVNVDLGTTLVLGCDEAVTLLVVEILDRTTRHGCSSLAA